jgi:hypothetical protein
VRLWRNRKPLHPKGRVVEGRLVREGLEPRTGVEFLDQVRVDEVLVRESRSIGLPSRLPDIHGLAIRVTEPDGSVGDLLFASTGWGRLTRYLLTASRTTYGRPMTTLLPYRSVAGRVVLGARETGMDRLELACSIDGAPWRRFAELVISDLDAGDPMISFDPVLNQVPGLEQYAVVTRLREPAYRAARGSRTKAPLA